jgi:hypothetical protein
MQANGILVHKPTPNVKGNGFYFTVSISRHFIFIIPAGNCFLVAYLSCSFQEMNCLICPSSHPVLVQILLWISSQTTVSGKRKPNDTKHDRLNLCGTLPWQHIKELQTIGREDIVRIVCCLLCTCTCLYVNAFWERHAVRGLIGVANNRTRYLVALGVIVVCVLATGPKVRGFKPGRGRWILRVIKSIARLPSEGK